MKKRDDPETEQIDSTGLRVSLILGGEKRRVIDLTIKSFSPSATEQINGETKRGLAAYFSTIHPTIARLLLCVGLPCLCVGPPRPMVAAEARTTMTTPQRLAMFGSEVINSSVRPVVEAFLLLIATEPVPMDPMDRRVLLRGRNRPR